MGNFEIRTSVPNLDNISSPPPITNRPHEFKDKLLPHIETPPTANKTKNPLWSRILDLWSWIQNRLGKKKESSRKIQPMSGDAKAELQNLKERRAAFLKPGTSEAPTIQSLRNKLRIRDGIDASQKAVQEAEEKLGEAIVGSDPNIEQFRADWHQLLGVQGALGIRPDDTTENVKSQLEILEKQVAEQGNLKNAESQARSAILGSEDLEFRQQIAAMEKERNAIQAKDKVLNELRAKKFGLTETLSTQIDNLGSLTERFRASKKEITRRFKDSKQAKTALDEATKLFNQLKWEIEIRDINFSIADIRSAINLNALDAALHNTISKIDAMLAGNEVKKERRRSAYEAYIQGLKRINFGFGGNIPRDPEIILAENKKRLEVAFPGTEEAAFKQEALKAVEQNYPKASAEYKAWKAAPTTIPKAIEALNFLNTSQDIEKQAENIQNELEKLPQGFLRTNLTKQFEDTVKLARTRMSLIKSRGNPNPSQTSPSNKSGTRKP